MSFVTAASVVKSIPDSTSVRSSLRPDLINRQIRLFIHALRQHQYPNATLPQHPQFFHQIPPDIVQSAESERLNHQSAIARLCDKVQHIGLRTGEELEQEHAAVNLRAELVRHVNPLRTQEVHAVAVHHAGKGAVDAVKGIEGERVRFDGARAKNQLAVEADVCSGDALTSGFDGAGEVDFGIGEGRAEGQLAAGPG